MSGYPVFHQLCKDEFKKRYPEEQAPIELGKKCVERWKAMSEREKRWFNHISDMEKKRSAATIASADSKKKPRRTKKVKDPNAPKRALSGFFWFSNEERGKVKAANPDFGVGDIAKELGKRWADCDEQTKSKYEDMAEKDRQRYDKEKTAYQLKQRQDIIGTEDFDEDLEWLFIVSIEGEVLLIYLNTYQIFKVLRVCTYT